MTTKTKSNRWGEPADAGTTLRAWVVKHDSHGLVYDTLVFLPDGDEPETKDEWRRMPWLDSRPWLDSSSATPAPVEPFDEVNIALLQKNMIRLVNERIEARQGLKANSERCLQLQAEREEVKAQRDEAYASMTKTQHALGEAQLKVQKLEQRLGIGDGPTGLELIAAELHFTVEAIKRKHGDSWYRVTKGEAVFVGSAGECQAFLEGWRSRHIVAVCFEDR